QKGSLAATIEIDPPEEEGEYPEPSFFGPLPALALMIRHASSHPAAFSFDASLPTVCRANENNKGDTNGGRSRRSDLRVPQMPRDGYASFQRRIGRRRRLLNRHPQRKKGLAIKRGRTSAS